MKKNPEPVDFWALSGEALDDLVKEVWLAARKHARRARLTTTKGAVQESFLWDAVVDLAQPCLKQRGAKAQLARLLGVSRQAIHQHFVSRITRPDAERTLQVLVWLASCRAGRKSA
jgi:hypothetical protein